jgi:hypothetical protein
MLIIDAIDQDLSIAQATREFLTDILRKISSGTASNFANSSFFLETSGKILLLAMKADCRGHIPVVSSGQPE